MKSKQDEQIEKYLKAFVKQWYKKKHTLKLKEKK